MGAQDNLGPQFRYSRDIVGQIDVEHPGGLVTSHLTDLVGYGLRPASLHHPDDVPVSMYHGSKHKFSPGDLVESGHPGNFARRMSRVYMTEQAETTDAYKGARGYGRHVYEVLPTGWYGHRRDARGVEWASNDPLRVIREIPENS